MEGNTYRERSALGVSLDSGPTEGASCLELLEQSVLSSTLVVRQVEGVTKIVSDCKPVINPVQDITPDGRPMEGTTYPVLRLEVLRNRNMENMSSHEFNDQLLSSEYVNLNTAEMFPDQVRSVGQGQWNMRSV